MSQDVTCPTCGIDYCEKFGHHCDIEDIIEVANDTRLALEELEERFDHMRRRLLRKLLLERARNRTDLYLNLRTCGCHALANRFQKTAYWCRKVAARLEES